MRILLISDIHGNRAALEAIAEPHDLCLCLGDLVEYGVEPAPCIDWVRRHARLCVRGNHDHGVAQDVTVSAVAGFRYLTGATRPLTRARLGPADRRYLADLPVSVALTLNGWRVLLVHATPRDPLDEFAPADADFWARRLEHVEADVVCVGHSHQQFYLEIGRKRVVNPGSVGLQRDSDPRAGYAIIDNGRVELKRVEYPVEQTVRAVEDSPLPDDAKRMLAEVYRLGRLVKPAAPANGPPSGVRKLDIPDAIP
jgi:putative phosphoesterase